MLQRIGVIAKAAITAFFIALILQAVWSALIVVNLKTTVSIPWSAPVIVVVVWLAWQYLGGRWAPNGTAKARQRHLRAHPVPLPVFFWALLAGVLSLAALADCWMVMTQIVRIGGTVLPDMSAYPKFTVAVMIIAGSLIGPVMEQAGFWGYGQVMLEDKFAPPFAILIISIFFAAAPHPPMGTVLWPKIIFYFWTSIMFGVLAYFTGSILPGLVVHILGDLTFFTLIWPHDIERPLLGEAGAFTPLAWHLAQMILFTMLALLAYSRLRKRTAEV